MSAEKCGIQILVGYRFVSKISDNVLIFPVKQNEIEINLNNLLFFSNFYWNPPPPTNKQITFNLCYFWKKNWCAKRCTDLFGYFVCMIYQFHGHKWLFRSHCFIYFVATINVVFCPMSSVCTVFLKKKGKSSTVARGRWSLKYSREEQAVREKRWHI